MDVPKAVTLMHLGLVLQEFGRVMTTGPAELSRNPHDFPWELVICVTIIGLFSIPLFLWRSFQSVRSRLYARREKQLALKRFTLIEEKCELLDKLSLEKQREAACGKLDISKHKLEEVLLLETELLEEKCKHYTQVELNVEMSETIQSLEDELKSLKPKVAAAKTTLRTLRVSEANLKDSTAQALSENFQLQESCKQLLQEAEEWKEQVSHLNKHKVTLEEPGTSAAQILKDKDDHIRWLSEGIRKLKVWAFVLEEHGTHDGDLDTAMNLGPENPAPLDTQTKGALQHLMNAVRLNASLKSLERERDQVYTELREVKRASKDLAEHIKNVQSEQVILQSEHAQFKTEKEKLQQKANIIPELFEEGMKFYRKLMVEDHRQRDAEEKLPKVKENISCKTAELQTYKKVARELEEKLERTKLNHQREIISYEKKAHFNWLEAQDAEEQLQYLRQVNANDRQKLMEMEVELKVLEKDPNAFGFSNAACGREHFPRGPSPLAQPSCERRAFLSPIVLEGPLRPPPVLQQGGGKDSRSPDHPLEHHTGKERGDSSCDGLTGHRGAPPENGSLCPPRKQEERVMVPPSGQPFTDPAPPPHNSNVPVESKAVGPGFVPPLEVPWTQ